MLQAGRFPRFLPVPPLRPLPSYGLGVGFSGQENIFQIVDRSWLRLLQPAWSLLAVIPGASGQERGPVHGRAGCLMPT